MEVVGVVLVLVLSFGPSFAFVEALASARHAVVVS